RACWLGGLDGHPPLAGAAAIAGSIAHAAARRDSPGFLRGYKRTRETPATPLPRRRGPRRCEARILNKGVRERRNRDAPRRLNTTKERSTMRRTTSVGATRSLVAVLGLLAGLLAQSATARAASPDFDTVTWTPLGCENPDLVSHTSPSAADFAGDATFP